MSSILISEHSKSIYEFRGTMKINKSNKQRQIDEVEYDSCSTQSSVESGAR